MITEKAPLVSILIPAYNRCSMVRCAIESALAQSYPRLEIICADNASSDGTFAVLKEYQARDPRVRSFCNDTNVGATRNWMRCLEESRGEYVKLLFSDDWLAPHAIERMVQALERHPEAGLCYSAVTYHTEVEGTAVRSHVANALQEDGLVPGYRFLHGFLTGSISVPNSPGQALLRREDARRWLTPDDHNRMGLDCGTYGMGNDCLLYLRACNDYPGVYHIAEPLAHYRIHGDSITVASGADPIGAVGILSAFGHFLDEADLPQKTKVKFSTLLFARYLSMNLRRCLTPGGVRRLREEFLLLFPRDGAAVVDVLDREAAFFFVGRAADTLLRVCKGG